ncbi:MAG: hypothetical protein A2655_00345 [Candidatus Yanofskybacteria bacterium RIFCSPHIGHO2_01_FULL_43_42]|nr:MAG: hypothetical protein A2655_00345 [Candidatus Yanofskybacteria bacterium RIFCSPHIGHO2_01_FULL_43_42]OGN12594.1 MAG: hypothetical protein A3D48_04675 [Candidatus Yanofskybacteria bacterium RIFCSPHIGHO2_02_FULL_43_17]
MGGDFFTVNNESRINPIPPKNRTTNGLKIFIWERNSGAVKNHDAKIMMPKKIEDRPSVVIDMPSLSLKVRTSLSTTNLH